MHKCSFKTFALSLAEPLVDNRHNVINTGPSNSIQPTNEVRENGNQVALCDHPLIYYLISQETSIAFLDQYNHSFIRNRSHHQDRPMIITCSSYFRAEQVVVS